MSKESSVVATLGLWSALGVTALLAGCGSEPAPAQQPPQPAATAEPVVTPPAEPEPAADAGAGGAAGEQAETKPPPDKPKPSGRPAILMGPSAKISSTFGATPGAVLKLSAQGSKEPMVLKIPEWSLRTGYNITFELAKNVKGNKVVGPVFHLLVQPQEKAEAIRVDTRGEPFELRVPTFGKETVNLAYGEIKGAAAGKPTVEWTVHAPRNVDKSFGVAYFYVTYLCEAYVHATTAEPTAAGAAQPPAK